MQIANMLLRLVLYTIAFISGLDMAGSYNGYVYHTKHDIPEILPRGSLQNTGDNILALVREMANTQELADPSVCTFTIQKI